MLYVFPQGDDWRGSELYWDPIVDGTVALSLPATRFNFAISSKWRNPESNPAYFDEFKKIGEQLSFRFGPGFTASSIERIHNFQCRADGVRYGR